MFIVAGAALFSIDVQSIAGAIALVTTTETLVGIGRALSLPSQSGKAVIYCFASVTAGTSTTSLTINVYRGSVISGSAVFSSVRTIPAAAGGPQYDLNCCFTDVLSMATQAQYCFSVTQTAATANGSVTSAAIETELLSG